MLIRTHSSFIGESVGARGKWTRVVASGTGAPLEASSGRKNEDSELKCRNGD